MFNNRVGDYYFVVDTSDKVVGKRTTVIHLCLSLSPWVEVAEISSKDNMIAVRYKCSKVRRMMFGSIIRIYDEDSESWEFLETNMVKDAETIKKLEGILEQARKLSEPIIRELSKVVFR